MIFVTGDTHGKLERLGAGNFPEGCSLGRDDYVIVLGDAGLLWYHPKRAEQLLNWAEKLPYTLLLIDGNHENFTRLNQLPVETWQGGKIHRLRENVCHLMRGQVFTLNGKRIFTFGGAHSINWPFLTPEVTWWPEELPSSREKEEGFENLSAHQWQVDYVLTHTCPQRVLPRLERFVPLYPMEDTAVQYLQEVSEKTRFRHWYFGHWHLDLVQIEKKFTALFREIVCIQP